VDRLTQRWLAARDGETDALADAIALAQPDVWRFLRHLVGPDLVDDATQDTFVRAWKALPRFRGDSTARTWLLGIARRAGADAVRTASRRRRADRLAVTPTPWRSDGTDGHAVDELVGALPPKLRESFILTQVLGLPYHEAADACAVPIGTIRSRVARAREALIGSLAAAEQA
jgi:RNA polymerase sigma-70 factor (ECF subfamily)